MLFSSFVLVLGLAIVIVLGVPNKIRVCSNGESVEVNDASCKRGWWMSEGITPECVCVTGTWFISENYCDANFYLISGPKSGDTSGTEFTCFKIPSQFRRVISFGSQSKIQRQFLVQSNGRSIQEVNKKSFSPTAEKPVVIIRLNANNEMYLIHKEGVQSDIWQKCLGVKRSKRAYTHIIKTEESVTYLKNVEEDELCDDVRDTDFPYERSNNTDWIIEQSGAYGWNINDGLLPINECSCPPPRTRSKPLTPKPNSKSKLTLTLPDEEVEPDPIRNTDPDYDSLPADSFNIYPKKKDPLVHAEHLTDNARTTTSILTKLKDYILTGVRPPPFRNPLFEYIRHGKKILTKFCPEIRPEVIGNLVGMFRLLLGYIINKYPEEYSLNVDNVVHQRVVNSLNQCLKGMGNRSVTFSWTEEQRTGTKCAKKKIQSVVLDGKTMSITSGGGMPDELRFVDGDVMLEVAWKLLLGTHYTCAEYFVDNPEDLSFMYVKTQEFLTIPYIMFRWENPAKGLTQAYRVLNPNLHPEELGEQIDACVWAAFDSSRFNTWLSRPASEREFIPKSVLRKSIDKLTGKSDSLHSGRSSMKRNGMTNKILDKVGYCVHDFNDPLSWNEIDNSETTITGC